MSLYQSNQLAGRIGFLWKTFVRSSSNDSDHVREEQTYHLGFQGNEAKLAYEEIINHEKDTTSTLNKKRHTYENYQQLENRKDSNKNLETIITSCKKNQSSCGVVKVSVNVILKAVEQRDLKFLQKYITLENVNLSDEYGWTPLMSAAYCGHLDIVEFLLGLGANRKARERSGLTAAQLALKKNYLGIVALLKKKVQIGSNNISEIQTDSVRPCIKAPVENHKSDTNINFGSGKESYDNKGFYCEICKQHFQETTLKKHENSTLHIFNTKPKLPLSIYGISKQNKGYQILLNTGWDEESGLGPSGKGIKYPIKTYLKIDRKGIGQPLEREARVTHFKAGDASAVNNNKMCKQKPLKKRDREKLINRETRKERALRIALS